jgi:hypothetical protein
MAFCSFKPKYKHPGHVNKAREHKACILQRTTKDDGADEFDPEFSMQCPSPLAQHWYNGAEGEMRLHSARNERQRTPAQGAGGVTAAAGDAPVQPRRIVIEGEDSEDRTPIQRSKVWDTVKILEEGTGTRIVKGQEVSERYKKIRKGDPAFHDHLGHS